MNMIQLHYGHTSAQVQTQGAQLASLKCADGREVIWQADPNVWAQHTPVLFPVCGSVRDGKIRIAGEEYPMTKHGFTRTPEFAVCKKGEDFVDLVLTPTDDSRAMYPFNFAFHVIYQLFEGGYTSTFLVENLDTKPMPFCVGGHPGFACPMEADAAFEDYDLIFAEQETGENALAPGGYLIDGSETLPLKDGHILPLNHQLFDERDALIFTTLRSRSVKVAHRVSGKGLKFDFPKMEVLAVWTKPGTNADYLCLEPWHGMPGRAKDGDNFEDKPFVTILSPGESYLTWFTATLI